MCHCCHEILVIIIPWNMSKVSLLFFYIVIVSCQAVALMINDSGLWHVVNVSLSLAHSLQYFALFDFSFFLPLALSLWVMCVFFVFCWKQFIYAIDMFFAFFSVISLCCFLYMFVCLLTILSLSCKISCAHVKWQCSERQGEREIKNFDLKVRIDLNFNKFRFYGRDCWP